MGAQGPYMKHNEGARVLLHRFCKTPYSTLLVTCTMNSFCEVNAGVKKFFWCLCQSARTVLCCTRCHQTMACVSLLVFASVRMVSRCRLADCEAISVGATLYVLRSATTAAALMLLLLLLILCSSA